MSPKRIENMTTSIASMNRSQLKRHIKCFKGRFKLDFTDDYLDSLSASKLQHILLAAVVTRSC